MADQIKTPRGITLDRYLDMIRAGAHDAVADALRGESGNPSGAFFDAVRDGIAAATRAVVASGQLRVVPPAPEPGAPAAEGQAPKEEEPPRP